MPRKTNQQPVMDAEARKHDVTMARRLPIGDRQWLAWQGFTLAVPRDWNVVRIEGDRRNGVVLLADLSAGRLGVRWVTPGKLRASASEVVERAMRGEVGELAAEGSVEVKGTVDGPWAAQRLFEEPEPPGRDVWIGLSRRTGRLVQVTYHATRRDGVLAGQVLPWLDEQPADGPLRWSALDLSVQVPTGYELASHQLSAGDLRLSFVGPGRQRIEVRQIGPATLALSRQGLEMWLKSHIATVGRVYRAGAIKPYGLESAFGRLEGLRVEQARRPWAFLRRSLMLTVATLAVHDAARNRLAFVQAGDIGSAESVLRTVGWHAHDDGGDGVS